MTKKKENLHSLGREELRAKARQLDEELFRLRMQLAVGQLSNTSAIRSARKELARVLTVTTLKEREGRRQAQSA